MAKGSLSDGSIPAVLGIEISGVVTVAGSEHGVPGLLVEVSLATDASIRLGSTTTGPAGRFRIRVETATADDGARRPTPFRLSLLAPEKPGSDRSGRVLFESDTRVAHGGHERFLVELDRDLLVQHGLGRQVDHTRPAARRRSDATSRSWQTRNAVSRTAERLAVQELEQGVSQRAAWRTSVVERVRREVTATSSRERSGPRFVADPAQVHAQSAQAQYDELGKLTETEPQQDGTTGKRAARRPTRIAIPPAAQTQLGIDGMDVVLTQQQLEAALDASLTKLPAIERMQSATDPCRPLTEADRCLKPPAQDDGQQAGGSAGGSDGGAGAGNSNQPGSGVQFTSTAAVARLMDSQTAPEELVRFGGQGVPLERALTPEELPAAVGNVTLAPGPADVPAFHDFTELQLAFEPVWQEALDDRVFDDVDMAFDRIVEEGLEQTGYATGNVTSLDGVILLLEGLLIAVRAVPADTAANVHISLEEYRALPASLRSKLDVLAGDIEDKRRELIAALVPPEPEDDDDGGGLLDPITDVIDAAADAIANVGGAALMPILAGAGWLMGSSAGSGAYNPEAIALLEQIRILQSQADRLVAHARSLLIERDRRRPYRPTHELIRRLRALRAKGYPFRHFAASERQRSVNFGLMVTYRQIWTPVSYQVGDLVSTVPLGPKETRKYTKRETRKRRKSEKELDAHVDGSKFDSSVTSKGETEIVAKASAKTSFAHTAEGTITFGGESGFGGSAKGTASFRSDADSHSQDVKRTLRESVVKAANERRHETKLEVDTEETLEFEFTEAGELVNPNDEITCTFLMYELQRRYKVHEKLHRLQSVVLVAQEMPRAADLNADWLIRHDWIIGRVLLDDSFKPALTYVTTTLVADRVTLDHMRQALLDQQALVEEIKEDLADRRSLAGLRYGALERQISRTAEAAEGGIWDTISDVVSGGGLLGGVLGGGVDGEDNAAKIREAAARDAWERDRREEEEFANRLADAQSTLATMRADFHARLSTHQAELTQVERLSTHIYQNILHYMQAIWAHEPDDQRFLRLREVPIPVLEINKSIRDFRVDSNRPAGTNDVFTLGGSFGGAPRPPKPAQIETRPLAEVADLSNPLGFMGNYMILPLYETNAITDFMMEPYVEFAAGEYRISDPDPAGNLSLDEFSDYVCCLREQLSKRAFAARAAELRAQLETLLQRVVRDNEEIVVGTGNLYIEALPGAHSIMEQYKHLHRQIDVKTAQENLRGAALNSVRKAERILNGELEDPDIEATYRFEDAATQVVAPAPPAGGGR
jgi:hypothetical protein